jgi:hypothetical protein
MKDLLSRIPLRRRRSGAVRTDGSTTPIAGVDSASAAPVKPGFRDRGRLRRRLRYLRRVRELGFRDLGGLVFDQHRFNRPNEELVRGKLAALHAVDAELRALEVLLGDPRPIHELREPGITACMRCGTIHGSDARFCPNCGLQVRGPRAVGEVSGAAAEAASAAATTPVPPVPPAPALQPSAEPAPSEPAPPAEAEPPTEVARPADGS